MRGECHESKFASESVATTKPSLWLRSVTSLYYDCGKNPSEHCRKTQMLVDELA